MRRANIQQNIFFKKLHIFVRYEFVTIHIYSQPNIYHLQIKIA